MGWIKSNHSKILMISKENSHLHLTQNIFNNIDINVNFPSGDSIEDDSSLGLAVTTALVYL